MPPLGILMGKLIALFSVRWSVESGDNGAISNRVESPNISSPINGSELKPQLENVLIEPLVDS